MTKKSKSLPKGTYFTRGPKFKKYTAHIPLDKSNNHWKIVHFGDNRYEHYRDSVPASLGGAIWKYLDHLDKKRRADFRKRHGAQGYYKKKFSAAWFSYYFLW